MGKRENYGTRGTKNANVALDWQLEGLRSGKTHKIELQLGLESYEDEYRHRRKTNGNRRTRRSSKPTEDKVVLTGLSYVNAHFQFIVDPALMGPGVALDANLPPAIESVARVVTAGTNFTCPICLGDEIVAPRMITSCGHVMCLKCLLSLLDSELPAAKKREAKSVVEKYRECPLCQVVIRHSEVVPVLFNPGLTFVGPKPGELVQLVLMNRPANRSVAIDSEISAVHEYMDDFASLGMLEPPQLGLHSRLLKSSHSEILQMLDREKEEIINTHAVEKEWYGEDDKYVKMALQQVDKELEQWHQKWQSASYTSEAVSSISPPSTPFMFYQLGPSVQGTIYVMASLDMKFIKAAFGDSYDALPPKVTSKMESITFEELTHEKAVGRLKYLAHLPVGTQVGFIECNWSMHPQLKGSPAWKQFESELVKRSKRSTTKSQREERNRRKALANEEIRNRNFFERENSGIPDDEPEYLYSNGMGSLSIHDHAGILPELVSHEASAEDPSKYKQSVWGTAVLKSEQDGQDELEAQEMIRKAKEEMERLTQSGKKKKKRIVLTSTM